MTTDAFPTNTIGRRVGTIGSIQGVVAAFVVKWYSVFVVSLWVFVPELRRLIDWQIGFNSISFVNLLPLLSLIPPCLLWIKSRQRLSGPLGFAVATMTIVLLYGLYIAWASGGLVPGVYEFMQFVLPMGFALWFAGNDVVRFDRDFERFCSGLLVIVGISAVYGLVQFASPPPWDVVWVVNSGLGSIGQPVPFALRVFGTLNAPGPFADVLFVTILLNIKFLQRREIWRIALLFPILAAFALTLARSQWLALVLGLIVYGLFTPTRKQFIGVLAILAIAGSIVAVNLDTIFGSASGANEGLVQRLSSFGSLDSDDSAAARQEILATSLNDINMNPLGAGLGATGTAAKLSSAQETNIVDNGYVARLLEFGYLGFAVYLLAIITPFILGVRAFFVAHRRRDVARQQLIATCLAVQVALIGIETSSDHHVAFTGMIFWIVVAIVYANEKSMVNEGNTTVGV